MTQTAYDKVALLLQANRGLTIKEMVNQLGIPRGTVSELLYSRGNDFDSETIGGQVIWSLIPDSIASQVLFTPFTEGVKEIKMTKLEKDVKKFETPREFTVLNIDDAPDGYKIIIVNDTQIPFQDPKTLRAVHKFWDDFDPDLEVYNGDIIDLYCPVVGTRILTADLHWVPVEELKVGSKLISFDEQGQGAGGRKIREGTVTSLSFIAAPVYRVELSDGTVLRCTGEHQWLQRYKGNVAWRRTDELYQQKKARSWQVPKLIRFLSVWEVNDDNYLGGFFDGEGTISNGPGLSVAAGQVPGNVIEGVKSRLTEQGFDFGVTTHDRSAAGNQDMEHIFLKGGYANSLRFLGMTQPKRLIEKKAHFGQRLEMLDAVEIVSIELDGEHMIAQLSVDPPTYFAEGFGAHNSISSFDRNPTRAFHLQDELDESYAWLFSRAEANPNARRIFIEGNHEDRLRRFLWKEAADLSSLRVLNFEELMRFDELEMEDLTYMSVLDFLGFRIQHGWKASGGSTPWPINVGRFMAQKEGSSGLCGHTHRASIYCWTTSRGSHSYVENGCLCRFDLEYAPFPNWQQAFSYGEVKNGKVHMKLVQIYPDGFIANGEFYPRM